MAGSLLSKGCHPPQRVLGAFDPRTNCVPVTHRLSGFMDSTCKCLQLAKASGFALGLVEHGHAAVIWVDGQYFSACGGLKPGTFAQYPAQEKQSGLEEQELH